MINIIRERFGFMVLETKINGEQHAKGPKIEFRTFGSALR